MARLTINPTCELIHMLAISLSSVLHSGNYRDLLDAVLVYIRHQEVVCIYTFSKVLLSMHPKKVAILLSTYTALAPAVGWGIQ